MGISQRRIAIYCKEGRIKGAKFLGRAWFIPKEAMKPIAPRRQRKLDVKESKYYTRECTANGKT